MFIGRKEQQDCFQTCYNSKKSQLVAIYGRRRIGKSSLIKHVFSKKPHYFYFEGLEDFDTKEQIEHFCNQLQKVWPDPLLSSLHFKNWNGVFEYITIRMQNQPLRKTKMIFIFDEFQWMAVGRTKLQALIKHYWDGYWKDMNILLVLCGSGSSYMIDKVIKSKALYGRITGELCVKGLSATEAVQLVPQSRGTNELLKYLLVFGGVPFYYTLIDGTKTFEQNIESLCFEGLAPLKGELEKIFFSQFREPRTYLKIIQTLMTEPLTIESLASQVTSKSSGGFLRYLRVLIATQFIQQDQRVLGIGDAKNRLYRVTDPFLIFLAQYVYPAQDQIEAGGLTHAFRRFITPSWSPWSGLAFERLVINNALLIAKKLNFVDDILAWGPLRFYKVGKMTAQYDLVFRRNNESFIVCEIKYHKEPVGLEVISKFERKLAVSHFNGDIEKVLICFGKPKTSLLGADYFHHIFDFETLLKS